jgi:hypothetical protein
VARYVLFHIPQIVVRKYEKHDSLLIKEQLVTCIIGASIPIVTLVRSLVNYADQIGKNGISVLADMGSFLHHNILIIR